MDDFFGKILENKNIADKPVVGTNVLQLSDLGNVQTRNQPVQKKRGRPKTVVKENDPKRAKKKKNIELFDNVCDTQQLQMSDIVYTIEVKCDQMFEYRLHKQCYQIRSVPDPSDPSKSIEYPIISSRIYPKSSKDKCQLCGRFFTSIPVMIPSEYDIVTKKYTLYGNYCRVGCAKRSIMEKNEYNSQVRVMYLHKLARDVFGISGPIPLSPPSLMFQINNGPIDPEEYNSVEAPIFEIMMEPVFVNHIVMSAAWKNILPANIENLPDHEKIILKEQEEAFWEMNNSKPLKNHEDAPRKKSYFSNFISQHEQ